MFTTKLLQAPLTKAFGNLQKHGRLWTLPGALKALAASKSFESPNSDEGESYRDAGPVEGHRYPLGNSHPTTFSQPCLGQGRSYRDAGPVEGQRYPFGNPNQSATPRHFHSLVLVKGDRIGTLARSRGSATPSVTQTNQPPHDIFTALSWSREIVSGRWPGRGAALPLR